MTQSENAKRNIELLEGSNDSLRQMITDGRQASEAKRLIDQHNKDIKYWEAKL